MITEEESIVASEEWQFHLKVWRLENKISLNSMASLMGIDHSLLSRYESGERVMRLSHFIMYLAALNMYVSPMTGLDKFKDTIKNK